MDHSTTEPLKADIELTPGKRNLVLAGLAIMVMTVTMSGQGVTVNLSQILGKFNSTHLYALLTMLGGLGTLLVTPFAGKLGDLIGRRNIALMAAISVLVMTIGMAWGAATNVWIFVAFRMGLGIATGMITGGLFAIIPEIFPRDKTAIGFAVCMAAIALGSLIGGVVSGALGDAHLITTAILYPAVLTVLGAIPVVLIMPTLVRPGKKQLDLAGMLFLGLSLITLVYACNFYIELGWGHPYIWGSLVASFILMIVFYFYEQKVPEPLVPFRLFKNMRFTSAILINVFYTVYMVMIQYYTPLHAQTVVGTTAAISGLIMMPRVLLMIILPVFIAAWVVKKKGREWKALAIGGGLIMIAMGTLAVFAQSTPLALIFFMMGVCGISDGFWGVTLNSFAQSQLKREDLGIGMALVTFMNSEGSVLGAVFLGLVFNATWKPLSLIPTTLKNVLSPNQVTSLLQSATYKFDSTVIQTIRQTLPTDLAGTLDSTVNAIVTQLGTSIGWLYGVAALCALIVILLAVFGVRETKKA